MRLNFFRRFRIAPGLWLNVSKRGVSATAGMRGFKATVGKRGPRVTVGLPGSGLSATHAWKITPKPRSDDSDLGRRLVDKALSDKGRPRD